MGHPFSEGNADPDRASADPVTEPIPFLMNVPDLEVVWPLHQHHYLAAHLIDEGSDMAVDETEATRTSWSM